ncbi:MAG: YlmC/YmxH family sporulation protein [Bacilli bacterium]
MKLSELSSKDVISDLDGCRLGRIVDLEIDAKDGKINKVIICKGMKMFSSFTKDKLEIPWSKIVKVGNDVVLVSDSYNKEKTNKEHKS